jgi:uncharacterized protein YfkK (UPF0435 family)
MDLSQPTQDNVRYMIGEIAKKLKMASAAAMKADDFSTERYEDIRDIYDMVTGKDRFSINEMEAIVSELGRLRRN